MSFEWTTNEIAKKTATIYRTNITLNTAACKHFENVQYVLLGIDREKKQIGIKPIDKQTLEQNIYPKDQLHRISIGKSYGRISNKTFIENVIDAYGLDINDKTGCKYTATFDYVHKIMVVEL